MNSNLDFEPHELMPVAVMRCLAIVEYLGRSTSAKSALTIQKAAVFDASLKNPNVARRLLLELAPDKVMAVDLSHVLYPNDAEHGLTTNTLSIIKVATLLSHAGLISLEQSGGVLILKPGSQQTLIDLKRLPEHWMSTLKALKSLLSKSTSTLQQAVIKESKNHAEPHVFIARTVDPQRCDEKL